MFRRTVTAICLLAAFGWFLLFNPSVWARVLVPLALMGIASFEWAKLSSLSKMSARLYALLGVVLLITLGRYPMCFPVLVKINLSIWPFLWWAVLRYPHPRVVSLCASKSVRMILGYLLLLPVWGYFAILTTLPPGLFLSILMAIWIADTAGYFVGRQWGRRALLPAVSPKKTWEGLLGTVLCVGLYAWVMVTFFFPSDISVRRWVIWALLTAPLSLLGDLTVSLFKRVTGVKDTGSILPGHGGLLDRFDSALCVLPFFCYGLLH